MAIYSLAEIELEIATYKTAISNLAVGKTVTIGDKTVTNHDLPVMREHLQWLDDQRSQLVSSGGVVPTAVRRTYGANGRGRS